MTNKVVDFEHLLYNHLMNKNNKGSIRPETIFGASIALMIIAFIGFAIVSTIGFPGGINSSYSNGSRTGTINKFSQKGFIFKSWEGEAVMGGMKSSTDQQGHTQVAANVFVFSVTDDKIIQDVQQALDRGNPVKLTYHQYWITPIGQDSTYVIDRVDTIK